MEDSELDAAVPTKETPPSGYVHYKTTESIMGFLVYVAMIFWSLMPYLNGIYLTLNSWREGRDKHGWKVSGKQKRNADSQPANPPTSVKKVTRFDLDLHALMDLTTATEAPRIPV